MFLIAHKFAPERNDNSGAVPHDVVLDHLHVGSDHRHPLVLVSAEDHTSVWRLRDPHGHDVTWIAAHATHLEIPPLPVCR